MHSNQNTYLHEQAISKTRASRSISIPTSAHSCVRRLSSHVLLAGSEVVEIEHNGALYRLRQTSLGKLILTK